MTLTLRILLITSMVLSASCTHSKSSQTPVVQASTTTTPTATAPATQAATSAMPIATAAPAPSSELSRIQRYQARFDSSTPAERKLIRLGEVAVGFDQDQVRMSLGEPDRTTTVDTSNGTSIAWEYLQREDPSVGLSIGGLLRSGGKLSTGAGVNVNTNLRKTKLQKLVIFDQQSGQVRKIETYE